MEHSCTVVLLASQFVCLPGAGSVRQHCYAARADSARCTAPGGKNWGPLAVGGGKYVEERKEAVSGAAQQALNVC